MPVNTVAIVDPYSSGKWLAGEFTRRGYECVAVQSTRTVPPLFRSSFRPDDFRAIIRHRSDFDKTVERLRKHAVRYVVSGCDLGVELADRLSERLGLLSNGAGLAEVRRDKFLMTEAARAQGLRTAAQFRAQRLDELMEWVRRYNGWPLVVKPPKSAGSDGVFLCSSEADVANAYHRIMDRRNMLGLVNTAVLAQEYLQGTEYVVDTVSYAGERRIAAFWKYSRPAHSAAFICYDAMELLPYTGQVQERLFAYATEVLDALQIRYGPAHCELMWGDNGPVLIEVNARLSAGNNPILSRICGATCALDLTIAAYLDPEQFVAEKDRPYRLSRTAVNCFLMPACAGRLKALPRLCEIESLPSFYTMSIGAKPGRPVPRVAGVVTLIHASRSVIEQDLRRIRDLERNGLYMLEEDQ